MIAYPTINAPTKTIIASGATITYIPPTIIITDRTNTITHVLILAAPNFIDNVKIEAAKVTEKMNKEGEAARKQQENKK